MTYGFSSFTETTNSSGGNWGATGVTSNGAVVKFGSHRNSKHEPVDSSSLKGGPRTPYADKELESLHHKIITAKENIWTISNNIEKFDHARNTALVVNRGLCRCSSDGIPWETLFHEYENSNGLSYRDYQYHQFYKIEIDETARYSLRTAMPVEIYAADGEKISFSLINPESGWLRYGVDLDLAVGSYYIKRSISNPYLRLYIQKTGEAVEPWISHAKLTTAESVLLSLEKQFAERALLTLGLQTPLDQELEPALEKETGSVVQVIQGDANENFLNGTNQDDKIFGMGGKDKIKGFAGDDVIDGGKGNDKLWGGSGADVFVLSAGKDKIKDFDPSQGDTLGVLRNGDYDYKFVKKGVKVVGEGTKTLVFGDTDELKQLINSMGEDLLTLM